MHHWASKIDSAGIKVQREGEGEEKEVAPPSTGETMERIQCLSAGRNHG